MKESNAQKKASGGDHAEAVLDSVRDLLYHDSRRVASFISQFDDFGLLQQIKRTEAVEEVALDKANMSSAVGLPGVARLQSGIDKQTVETSRDLSERTYDPLWTNAIAFLDYLEEHRFVNRNLREARIGQFVFVQGRLLILDLSMLKSAWEMPGIRKIIMNGAQDRQPQAGNRQQRRAAATSAHSQSRSPPVSEVDTVMGLLSILPHSVQARLISDQMNVWCSLDENSIVGRASDLLLKHGSLISGQWNMLGVLDAYPSTEDESLNQAESPN